VHVVGVVGFVVLHTDSDGIVVFVSRAAFQALHKACETARVCNYYPFAGSLSHTWIGYYLSEMTTEVVSLNEWLVSMSQDSRLCNNSGG
jgi:hypothetical protein